MSRRIIINWVVLILCLVALALVLTQTRTGQLIMPAQSDTPYTLLYYYQSGCPACDEIEPVIDTLEERYAGCITVRRLNIQWRRAPNVRGTPTVLLVDSEGEEVARWVGQRPLQSFIERIEPLCQR